MELDFPASGPEAAVDGQPFAIVSLSITRLRHCGAQPQSVTNTFVSIPIRSAAL